MPNVWYPVKALDSLRLDASLTAGPRSAADTGYVIHGPHLFYGVATLATACLAIWAVAAAARRSDAWRWDVTILVLFAAGTVILPMLFFSAHENHFYLVATLLPLLCVRLGSMWGLVAVTASLFLQVVNLVGLYGVGGPGLGIDGRPLSAPEPVQWLVDHYTSAALVAVAIANVLAVGFAAFAVSRRLGARPVQNRGGLAYAPAAIPRSPPYV